MPTPPPANFFGALHDANLRLRMRRLWTHVRAVPIHFGGSREEMSEMQEAQTPTFDWNRSSGDV